MLNGAIVYVCDPHYNKHSSIYHLLQPLSRWIHLARTNEEITAWVTAFVSEMEARVNGKATTERPLLLVIDEFTRLVTRSGAEMAELVVNAVVACAEEYAGFSGYAIIAGHEWTAEGKLRDLFAKLRRALHATFCHRLDADYARFLLSSKRRANEAQMLHTGHNLFQDSEGQVRELITPLGTLEDAVRLASQMAALPGLDSTPVYHPHEGHAQTRLLTGPDALDSLSRNSASPGPGETPKETRNSDRNTQGESLSFVDENEHEMDETKPIVLPETISQSPLLTAQGVVTSASSHEDRLGEVARLRALGKPKTEIIASIWDAYPGASRKYREAELEYEALVKQAAARLGKKLDL